MERSRTLTLTIMLALCVLLRDGALPAFAQGNGVADQPQIGVAGAPASTAAVQAALGTAFTYQGNLKKNGQPGNTTCSFQFSLWDALSSGAQRGATQTVNNVVVQAGVFSVELDFGNQFTGDARWLQTAVQCAGDAGFTTLAPRQPLNAVPYALSLRPGAAVNTTTTNVPAITANAPGGNANALVATGNGNGFAVIYGEDQSANGGHGVMGKSAKGRGVYGKSTNEAGVLGEGWVGVWGQSPGTDLPSGNGEYASGIVGISAGQYSAGVYGENSVGVGVLGKSASDVGVVGKSANGDGVLGTAEAANRIGVKGVANAAMGVGVWGESAANTGVYGLSQNGRAVWGQSTWGTGVVGESSNNDGIFGTTTASDRIGVKGVANAAGAVGVWGESAANTGVYGQTGAAGGVAVWGRNTAGGVAGRFEGSVQITGGADLAERFQIRGDVQVEPGTLMVIDVENPGYLAPSNHAYDNRVAGVVSGAGGVKPGLTLHQEGVMEGKAEVAIAGRVYVKAEATSAPIRPGDLLTTSSLAGHAMKATDRERAPGAIIGKAMTGLDRGTGLVLVLVNLQ